jgi:hypothetical protein
MLKIKIITPSLSILIALSNKIGGNRIIKKKSLKFFFISYVTSQNLNDLTNKPATIPLIMLNYLLT